MGRTSDSSPGRRFGPLVLLALPAVALALSWPYLDAGFAGDDVILLNLVRDGGAPPWWRGLWAKTDLSCLTSLWWVGTFSAGGFWRPLPSLVLQGSLALFGENPVPLHTFAILLHGVSGVLVALVTSRLLHDLRLGLLAGFFFVACEDHSMVVGWITTSTDVLASFFVALAMVTHVAWLERRRNANLVLSIGALVVALACKESAVAAPLGMAGLSAVFHARRVGSAPLAGNWARALARDGASWAPSLAVLVAYLVSYLALGFGVGGSLLYADPISEPLPFLQHLGSQLPVLWLGTLSPVPPTLAVFLPAAQPALAVAGVGMFVAFLLALRPLRREPVAWWALLFYLVALVPQTGAEGGERALYLPMVPASVLFALLVAHTGFAARRVFGVSSPAPTITRLAASWVLIVVLVAGVLLSAVYPFVFRASFRLFERQVASLVGLVRASAPEHVLVLNTSGQLLTFYLGDELSWRAGRRVDTRVLSSLNGVMTLERRGDRSIVLRTDRRGWLTNLFALVPRTSATLEEGQSFATDLFTATVVELAPGDGLPDALGVRFDLALSPDDPRLLLATWTGSRFDRLDLRSVPLGERRLLADTSDVWASMM
jgi:hypothetical protein